ncbi:DUF3054 domain-containing protein [Corynebacterium sp. YIM 101645]|uniref:DUF3054 domain-containing protein n=1 Tax=Corynebacterium lemuris TaxID=1859292 RepID=A0ABT2FZ59_9CORY|nr:DUF3054 domain-containing protein [Corynebacterium lemuris]MCS5480535.1 DUF3054 domain-containing protein [Corynebacterium lemuris]
MSRISALTADVVAIAAFALFARIAHQTDDMPLNFGGWLSTLWPFLLGVALSWVVITAAKWDGARLVPAGVSAWLITVVVGLGIWTVRNGEFPHWSFILVATIMSALFMLGWRAIAGIVGRRRRV